MIPPPCPLCSRRMCDHTPLERGQTFEQMMGEAPTPQAHGPTCLCPECTTVRGFNHKAPTVPEPKRDEQRRVLWRCRCGAEGACDVLRWWHAVWPDGRAVAVACIACVDGRIGELTGMLNLAQRLQP